MAFFASPHIPHYNKPNISKVFPNDAMAPYQARHYIKQEFNHLRLEELEDLSLALDELVTNVHQHDSSTAMIKVEVFLITGEICAHVLGSGRAVPRVVNRGSEAESGRGLILVEKIAKTWGVGEEDSRSFTYIAMDRPGEDTL
jgi:anti-sigma regulatory factor (Ser/Thr protein kinase)